MIKVSLSIAVLGSMFAAVLCAAPADAANLRSWVSNSGSGTACTEAAPCADLATALAATASGGEINCLNTGEYGNGATLTITQSVFINCKDGVANVTGPSGSPAISINGSGIIVALRNLILDGNGESTEGVAIANASGVALTDVTIEGFTAAGVLNEGSGKVLLGLYNCWLGPTGGLDLVQSAASGSGTFVLNSVIGNAKWGIAVTDGNGIAVKNSSIGPNSVGGIYGANGSFIYITGSEITGGNPVGVENAGTSTITINNSDITGNGTGVSGNWSSYGNNRVFGNTTSNGTAPTGVNVE
jgi:hypothetical protein